MKITKELLRFIGFLSLGWTIPEFIKASYTTAGIGLVIAIFCISQWLFIEIKQAKNSL